MILNVGRFRFASPPALTDVTGYSFTAHDTKEMIDVSADILPARIDTLDALLAARRQTLEFGLPGAIQIDAEGTTQLAGLPARTLDFSFSSDGQQFCEQWVLALDTATSYVQISSSAPADDPAARTRFVHVVRSASFSEPQVPPPAGFVRRWAGKLWLDVPAHLELPRTYAFVSADESLRIEVAHYPHTAPPAIDRELAMDTAHGEVVTSRSSRQLRVGPLQGILHTFTLGGAEDGVIIDDALRRAHFDIHHLAVHLHGRAPRTNEGALDAAFHALVASLEQVGP